MGMQLLRLLARNVSSIRTLENEKIQEELVYNSGGLPTLPIMIIKCALNQRAQCAQVHRNGSREK